MGNNIIESLPESYQKDVYANLQKAGENQAELLSAIAEAEETYLDEVAFLIANMPVRDLRSLSKNLLLEDIEYACRAREETEWGKMLSHELFLNYVLPYANVTERRDNWRRDFYNRFMPLVQDCETASEAVLKLNTEVFGILNVKYHARKRRKPDQSPYESMEINFASCTGLSILLADACRAVGIPARLTGVPQWTGKRGNHTWVEIWDSEWKFIGASENTSFSETWFVGNAAKADASKEMNRIYAVSYKQTGTYFPMTWAWSERYVPAVDVTGFYTSRKKIQIRLEEYDGVPEDTNCAVLIRYKGEIVVQKNAKDKLKVELVPGETYEMEIHPDGSNIAIREELALPKEKVQDVMSDCTVSVSVPCSDGFSADSVVDGDVRTAPFWADVLSKGELSQPAEDDVPSGGVEYTFEFSKPEKINRIRFLQSEKFCAISYRILAREADSEDFAAVLASVEDRSAPGGVWIEHEFAATEVNALKFQPLVGFGYGPGRFPVLCEFEAYLSDGQRTPVENSDVYVSVSPDRTYSINGFDHVHDTMFSITGATAVGEELSEKYIKPLNLGVITHWPFWGNQKDLLIPEDAENPGNFDRDVVTSGKLREKAQSFAAGWERNGKVGAFANVGLITAPDFMRDVDYGPTVEAHDLVNNAWQRLAPPKDPAEWGRWEGHIVKAINEATDGIIKWVYIWNEPNASRYLPVPWSEKPERYIDLYSRAVPEIKKLNPELKVGGPVITGAGILGWNKPLQTSGENGWLKWIKAMIDQNGHLMDHLDVHTYRIDSEAFIPEAALVANYCRIKGLGIIPIAASEGAIAAAIPNDYDPIAARWRYNTVFWADYILKCLDLPDRMVSQSYFHVWDCASVFGIFDRYNWEPKYAREDYNPQPIYWFYWLIRDLRGRRLWRRVMGEDVNVVATATEDRVVTVIQNKKGIKRNLNLRLADLPVDNIEVDFVEYSPQSGQLEHGTREAQFFNGRIGVAMQPYGLYAVKAHTESHIVPDKAVAEIDYMGDKVFQRLDRDGEVEFHIKLDDDYAAGERFLLRFGTSGIPFSRPAVAVDRRVPLLVDINGRRDKVLAGKNNEIILSSYDILEQNTIKFSRSSMDMDDPRIVDPDDFFILSTSIAVFTEE